MKSKKMGKKRETGRVENSEQGCYHDYVTPMACSCDATRLTPVGWDRSDSKKRQCVGQGAK